METDLTVNKSSEDGPYCGTYSSGHNDVAVKEKFLVAVENNGRTEKLYSVSIGQSKLRHYKNLAILCLSFLLLFSAFLSLQNLQSSLNISEGLGTVGLTTIYVSLIVSSLFLPGFTLSKLGIKWAMVLSLVPYLGYIAASFYAVWATIIPTSILLGLGGANLWAGQMAYITQLSRGFPSTSHTKDRLFGIFFATFHTGLSYLRF